MTGCALYGKLRGEADFVRVGEGLEGEIELQRWFKAAVEQSAGKIPQASVRFVARSSQDASLWAGCWVPSQDSVGREFPLAIYARLDDDVSQLPWSCLPVGLSRFITDVEQSLTRLAADPDSDAESARSACAELAPPHMSELPAAWSQCAERAELSAEVFAERVFGHGQSRQWLYAVHVLQLANESQLEGSQPNLVFPLLDVLDTFIWLELWEQSQPGGHAAFAPNLFWTDVGDARLVVGSRRDDGLLGPVWDQRTLPNRLWPTWTEHEEAIAEATTALPEEAAALLDAQPLSQRLGSLRS